MLYVRFWLLLPAIVENPKGAEIMWKRLFLAGAVLSANCSSPDVQPSSSTIADSSSARHQITPSRFPQHWTTVYAPPNGKGALGQVVGSDGAVWVLTNLNFVRFALDGTFTQYPLPHLDYRPIEIVRANDGNVWALSANMNAPKWALDKITPAGQIIDLSCQTTSLACPAKRRDRITFRHR